MPSLSRCPEQLPSDLSSLIMSFGNAWALHPSRPKVAPHIANNWSRLLEGWVLTEDMPLFVRKHSNNRGCVINHTSGRVLVPCDNSPAHWAYILATQGKCPCLNDIKTLLTNDSIPIAMIMKAIERPIAKYYCTLSQAFNVNEYGWKLAHIESVGLNTRTHISSIPIERLVAQFRFLMAPSNMFVVPLAWAGLAEIKAVIQAIATSQ